MNIHHIEDVSLINYPDHVASVIYTKGCSLECPYCYNPNLVSTSNILSLTIPHFVVMKRLAKNKTLINGVVITGGEPTIHPGLPYLLAEIDTMELDIKLDTNGTRPELLKKVMLLVDYVAMDVKSDERGYKWLGLEETHFTNILDSIKIIMESGKDYEFRCTAVEPFLTEETAWRIGEMVEGAKRFYIQKPRLESILDPTFPMCPTENLKSIEDVLLSYVAEVFIR